MIEGFLVMFLLPELLCVCWALLWVNTMQPLIVTKESDHIVADFLLIFGISFTFHILPAMYIIGVFANLLSF